MPHRAGPRVHPDAAHTSMPARLAGYLERMYGVAERDIAARLVITTGEKKGQHPSPATVLRMLRDHDEQTTRRPSRPAPDQTPHPQAPTRVGVTTGKVAPCDGLGWRSPVIAVAVLCLSGRADRPPRRL
ncbi:hypothetical protein, partial [Streptosporangium album]|uniref:hypothetical protein n=1 Tax=Streptosporangium album TaxID=47479 RepID=UPI003CD08F28